AAEIDSRIEQGSGKQHDQPTGSGKPLDQKATGETCSVKESLHWSTRGTNICAPEEMANTTYNKEKLHGKKAEVNKSSECFHNSATKDNILIREFWTPCVQNWYYSLVTGTSSSSDIALPPVTLFNNHGWFATVFKAKDKTNNRIVAIKKESLQASMPSLLASKAQESVGGTSPAFQNISRVSRVQGTPDTSELARSLPQKYRRRQMSDEEIEYIQGENRSSFGEELLPAAAESRSANRAAHPSRGRSVRERRLRLAGGRCARRGRAGPGPEAAGPGG
ncbi:hypothetical protein EK904_015050, partial [Melospiza melodia maxima]